MKINNTFCTAILSFVVFCGCKAPQVVSVNNNETAKFDKKQDITHVTTANNDFGIRSTEAAQLNILGTQNGQKGNYELARQNLLQALEIEGDNATILGNLGMVEMLSENHDLAESYMRRSIEVDSTYELSYMNLGVNYHKSKKYDKALEAWTGILYKTKDSSLIGYLHMNMSESYFELKECENSRESINAAKKIFGDKIYQMYPELGKNEKDIEKCIEEN